MKQFILILLLVLGFVLPAQAGFDEFLGALGDALEEAGRAEQQQSSGLVTVNDVILNAGQVQQLSQIIGGPVPEGSYWYDHMTGLWGGVGGPAQGNIPAGLPIIAGALNPDASGGQTDVFINGRAIHPTEKVQLQEIYGQVMPGRYIMNAMGQVMPEGGYGAYQGAQAAQPSYNSGGQVPQQQNRWYGAVDTGGGVYMPEMGGRSGGVGVGTASDGCTYVSAGDYSTEICD